MCVKSDLKGLTSKPLNGLELLTKVMWFYFSLEQGEVGGRGYVCKTVLLLYIIWDGT